MDPENTEDGHASDATSRTRSIGTGLNRRTVLAAGLAGGIGAAAGYAGGRVASGAAPGHAEQDLTYPFRGEHQQGITTPVQQQMHLTAFDVTTSDRDSLIDLLTAWSRAAENLTAGLPVDSLCVSKSAPPADTGEAHDLDAAGLTLTFGFGRTLFRDDAGTDRFGLADRLPAALAEDIPQMAAEKIDASRSGGDLVVQACAEDPLVALHAIRNLTRIAFGWATVRWTQLGYGRVSSTGADQTTARNLFGFKDGTASLRGDQDALLTDFVWVGDDDDDAADWMAGGTYLCARKIRMTMEVWDELSMRDQEETIGREKISGGPLSGGGEFDEVHFTARTSGGSVAIPEDSHIALMHPTRNAGVHMLRRGYNYTDGSDELGRLDAGLFFIAFVRDPRRHFTPLLARMQFDRLTEYLQHVTSSVFAIPPGLGDTQTYIGQQLFDPTAR